MTLCQIEEFNKGGAYPKSCPTCRLGGKCVKELPDPWIRPAPGLPSIDLRKIQPGDDIHVRFRVLELQAGDGLPVVRTDDGIVPPFFVNARNIVGHVPAALGVGQQVTFQGISHTIVALDHGTAWIRSDTGVGQLCDRYDLARYNGRPA